MALISSQSLHNGAQPCVAPRLWFGEATTWHRPFASVVATEEDERFVEIIKPLQTGELQSALGS